MSIIPVSSLSRSDLERLGNNLSRSRRPIARHADAPYRRVLAAVNRSLAGTGERVDRLLPTGGVHACR
ncbi:MAG TPA: hypothetical protein VIO57_04175 [Chloroflexota bacterium]